MTRKSGLFMDKVLFFQLNQDQLTDAALNLKQQNNKWLTVMKEEDVDLLVLLNHNSRHLWNNFETDVIKSRVTLNHL